MFELDTICFGFSTPACRRLLKGRGVPFDGGTGPYENGHGGGAGIAGCLPQYHFRTFLYSEKEFRAPIRLKRPKSAGASGKPLPAPTGAESHLTKKNLNKDAPRRMQGRAERSDRSIIAGCPAVCQLVSLFTCGSLSPSAKCPLGTCFPSVPSVAPAGVEPFGVPAAHLQNNKQ